MKKTMAIAILLAGVNASASNKPGTDLTVHVYVVYDMPVSNSMVLAQTCASKLLASAGVELKWHKPRTLDSAGPNDLTIRFVLVAPPSYRVGPKAKVLAFARPYASGGERILVFHDRVAGFAAPYGSRSWRVIGHVLAHEIGHVLEGIARHSGSGLMRAAWTIEDLETMTSEGLEFAPVDRELIRANLVGHFPTPVAAEQPVR